MPESPAIELVEGRLIELACPPAVLQRKIRELAEHREDLKQAALEEGLSESEADARADELLGEPHALAEYLAAALRQSSWWGRHPIIGFCALPPFAILMCLGIAMWAGSKMATLFLTHDQLNALADDSGGLALFRHVLQGIYYCAIVITSALFCWLARRSLAGLKWALAACAFCALNGWYFWLQLRPHNISAGYTSPASGPEHWVPTLLPLAVVAASGLSRRGWSLPRFAPNAAKRPKTPRTKALNLPRARLVTPTSVIAAIIFLAIGTMLYFEWRSAEERAVRNEELHSQIWPAERAQVLEHVNSRQSVKETKGETTIDLRSKVTVALADSFGGKPNTKGNSLDGLCSGLHVFGGVPFDVEGRVQLWGRGLADCGRKFPERVRNIAVGRKCARIHLLHSTTFAGDEFEGLSVAQLVLHYADGSQAMLDIKVGEQVQDWWGPIYKTAANPKLSEIKAAGSELAWVGTNPWIEQRSPGASLRLYKSTFENPHSDCELLSVDYVSTLTEAAPFMVGMTVE